MERSKVIFGNEIPARIYKKALKAKNKHLKKFGDDSNMEYKLMAVDTTEPIRL